MGEINYSIGQKYKDRKSGKIATLVSNDQEKKLLLLDMGTDTISIGYTLFKANWRKVQEDCKGDDSMDSVANFKEIVGKNHKVDVVVDDKQLDVYIDDVQAILGVKTKSGIHLEMLPDLFGNSSFVFSNAKPDFSKNMSISFDTPVQNFNEVLDIVVEAASEINMYGYIDE